MVKCYGMQSYGHDSALVLTNSEQQWPPKQDLHMIEHMIRIPSWRKRVPLKDLLQLVVAERRKDTFFGGITKKLPVLLKITLHPWSYSDPN